MDTIIQNIELEEQIFICSKDSQPSEHIYGLFEENSEDMYGLFDGGVAEKCYPVRCTCGIDICEVHPSNRSSGIYDPEDYNEDGTYSPHFDEGFHEHNCYCDICINEDKIKADFIRDVRLQSDNQRESEFRPVAVTERQTEFNGIDVDYVVDIAETAYIFFDLLKRRKKKESAKSHLCFCLVTILKMRFKGSLCNRMVSMAIPFVNDMFGITVQSEDLLQQGRELLTSWKNVQESPIVAKVYKCITFALSMSIFDKIGINMDNVGYTKIEQAVLKKKFYKKSDFAYVVLDTILFIAERGYQVYKTGDPTTIFHSGGSYQSVYDTASKLKRQSELLSDPESHGFTECTFRAELDDVIEKLQSINKHSFRLEKFEQNSIRILLDEMLMTRDDLTTRRQARKNRKAPFGILIFGDSGIGKTTITQMLFHVFCKIMNLPNGSEFMFTRNPKANFWDGFNSSCHTIIMDDIACEHPDLKDSSSVDEIIQVMNNAAFCPDQANLHDKGKTPMRAKFVVATTNRKDLNAHRLFTTASAVQRRLPFVITPKVKDEYLDEAGMLKSDAIPRVPFPDCWTWSVDLVKPVKVNMERSVQSKAVMEPILVDVNSQVFWKWFAESVRKFDENQNLFCETIQMMSDASLCRCCNIPEEFCLEIQTNDFEFLTAGCFYLLWDYIWNSHFLTVIKIWLFMFYIQIRIYAGYRNTQDQVLRYIRGMQSQAFWRRMGTRMMSRIQHPKALLGIASAIAAGGIIYKLINKFKVQGASDEVGSLPVAELDGRENVWYKDAVDITPLNFSRESASAKSEPFESFKQRIAKNCVAFVCENKNLSKTKIRPGKMVCLGGHIYVTNNHNIPLLKDSSKIQVVESSSRDGVNNNYTFVITEDDLERYPEKDLVILKLRNIPAKKKIVQYFMKGEQSGIFKGSYVFREHNGSVGNINLANMRPTKNVGIKSLNCTMDTIVSISEHKTDLGHCGALCVAQCGYGYMILGIHVGVDDSTGEVYSTAIDGKFLTEIYDRNSRFNIQSGDYDMISAPSAERKLTDLHKKSCFRYINSGYATIHGSFTDFRGKSKSRVENTPMSYILDKNGYKIKYTKPVMKSWVPWHIAAEKLVKPIAGFDSSILNKCVDGYVRDIMNNLEDPQNLKQLFTLDNFTAINGAQVTYLDKINRTTSAGNPWKKCKKFFMTKIPPQHGLQDPVEVHSEIMDRVDWMQEQYQEGKRANPVFCAHLKDEPVSFKKAKIGKTRVFTGAPFDWTILVRKFLLNFARLVQNERFAFEAAPGTIAQSLEWQEMYNYLTEYGYDRIVAGDFKAYDKDMSPLETNAAIDVIVMLCKESGNYSDLEIRIIRGIAEDMCNPLIDYNGDLITLHGSNPSGHPLTVIINCVVGSLRKRYMYYLLNPNHEVSTFRENVRLLTYGDDNIMGVREGCDWFNHTSISEAYASLNIVYTMADKEAESVPYINIADATFLKRRWQWDTTLMCFVAPLDHDSIEKMLMVWVASKSITKEAQCMAVIASAMSEYFFYGQEIFEEKRKLLYKMVHELEYEDYIEESTFPTYSELVERFKRCSRHTSLYHIHFANELSIQSNLFALDYNYFGVESFPVEM